MSIFTNGKGDILAAKVRIYANEPEEYFTFIIPEAYFCVEGLDGFSFLLW